MSVTIDIEIMKSYILYLDMPNPRRGKKAQHESDWNMR